VELAWHLGEESSSTSSTFVDESLVGSRVVVEKLFYVT
jgi:hypothetical protein